MPFSSPVRVGVVQSRPRNFELVADGARRRIFDFAMAWHCGTTTIGWVAIDRMATALAIENAAVPLQVANQVAAFHQAATSTDSVSQIAPVGATFAALSR